MVGGLILVLIAAPAHAAPPSHFGLRELLGPVAAPLQPVIESVGDLLAPITEPVDETLEPVLEPVVPLPDSLLEPVDDLLAPLTDPITDPILDPVEEVVDPIIDPVEEVVDPVEDVIDPPSEPSLLPADDGNHLGSPVLPPPSPTEGDSSRPPAGVVGSRGEPVASSAASFVSSAVSLLPPPSAGLVLAPTTLPQSLLTHILDWLSEADAGSLLKAPFFGLQVLLRALASAGSGLLVPGLLLVTFAFLMGRDRRTQVTETP